MTHRANCAIEQMEIEQMSTLALSKASKIIFDQKNEGFLSSYFTTDKKLFVVLNPSEKHREKQCFLILSSFSYNLTRKLIFYQKD